MAPTVPSRQPGRSRGRRSRHRPGRPLPGLSAAGLLLFASVFLARSPRPLAVLLTSSVAASLLLAGLTAWTGHLGGQITHGTDVAAAADNPAFGRRGDWGDD